MGPETKRRQFVQVGAYGSLAVALGGSSGCAETVAPDPSRHEPLEVLSEQGFAPSEIRLGVTPSTGEETEAKVQPLVEYLRSRKSIPTKLVIAPTYDALAEMVKHQEVHVGMFSPLAYVLARESMPAVAVASVSRGGSPTYLGYIAARADDPRDQLVAFKGSKVAWVDKSSTSGYLYPRALLRSRGHNPDEFFSEGMFLGDHLSVLDALLSGSADVAMVASAFVDNDVRQGRPVMDQVKVVAKTQRIPLDSVVVHKELKRSLAFDLRLALLSLDAHPEDCAALAQSWGVTGFVHANDARYDEIAAVFAREG